MGHKKEKSEKEHKTAGSDYRKWIVTVVILAILLFVFCIFLGREKAPSEKIVFTVGEEAVYLDEVYFGIIKCVDNLGITPELLESVTTEGAGEEYYKEMILRQITDYKVEYLVAKEQGIVLTEEEEKVIRKDVTDYLGTVDARILNKWGITKDLIEKVYTEWYIAHKLEESVTSGIEVEEQRFCTIYMMMFPKIEMTEDGDYARQEDGVTPILLSEEQIEKIRQDANQALQELEAGADVEEIAGRYGVEAYSSSDSNLAESFEEPFLQYTTTLKENECSPVIETEAFFAIVKMMTENNESFAEEILSYHRADLEQKEIETQRINWYKQIGVDERPDFKGKTWEEITLMDFVR